MTNKQIREVYYPMYLKSESTKLRDVYGRWSDVKEKAFERCQKLCDSMSGSRLTIVTHNQNIFTAGFLYYENCQLMYCHITPSNNYFVDI